MTQVSGRDVLPLEVASHTALQYIVSRAAPKLLAVRSLGMAADPAAQAVKLSFAVTTGAHPAELTSEVGQPHVGACMRASQLEVRLRSDPGPEDPVRRATWTPVHGGR